MVRNYKRKTEKASYSREKLQDAVRAVRNGVMSGYKAAKVYNIPRMTIMDHIHNKRGKSNSLGRNTALSLEVERKLASYIHVMERNGFGLTRDEILDIVADYVTQNEIVTPFKNGRPGKDWFIHFRDRNKLSIKKPQAVEYARKKAVDPFIIYPYFELLKNTIHDLGLTDKPSAIWNLDETSFSKDPSKAKIVGRKGHAATRIVSGSGKDNTTVLLAANAIGEKIPPLIIYKGKNVWDQWTSPEAYPNTTYAATTNGWMEAEVFENYFKKSFIPALGSQRPVLLIYDGHSTHVGLNILEEAEKENITILKLPAHSSHVLQPLDLAVMKSFKDRWDPLLVKWQRSNVGIPLPKNEFARLIGIVWTEIDPTIIQNGFRKAGIHPFNKEVIEENQFDILKLAQWKLYIDQQNTSFIQKNPGSLLSIVLNFINNRLTSDMTSNNVEVTYQSHESNCKVIFEELLLNKVKRGENTKRSRKKIAPGAEVITHTDVILRKREEKNKKKQSSASSSKVTYYSDNDSQIESLTCQETNSMSQLRSKSKRTKTSQPVATSSDVIYLSNVSRNDSECKPFAVKVSGDMPTCLQIPDKRKVKILSNTLIKKPTDVFNEAGPSGVTTRSKKGIGKKTSTKNNENMIPQASNITDLFLFSHYSDSGLLNIDCDDQTIIKQTKNEAIFFKDAPEDMTEKAEIPEGRKIKVLSNIIIKNPTKALDKELTEAGPSGLSTKSKKSIGKSTSKKNKENKVPQASTKQSRTKKHLFSSGSSTTSVSGSISLCSDSDSLNIDSDDLPIIKHTENEAKLENMTEEVERSKNECETVSLLEDTFVDSESKDITYYYTNDHVLVRYYTKNKWTYYIGIIEDILIQNEETNYSIRFYKTIKKPNLTFKMTKKVDCDVVPEILIIKHIELKPIPTKANEYVLCNDCDMIYF